MVCEVCNAPEAEMHFGGMSCRACAAFFRRFFHSKKLVIECTCQIRVENSHPCRYCRVQKCFSIGMTAEKVQKNRDKHSWKCNNGKFISAESHSILATRIVSRDTLHLSWTIDNWGAFEQQRSKVYGGNFTDLNIFEATSYVRYDMDIMWRFAEKIFPQTVELTLSDKNALLANFVPKWWQLEPVMDCAKNGGTLEDNESEQMVTSFYDGAFRSGKEMSKKEILNIFEPYFWFYYSHLILPIIQKNFDSTEYMAIVWITFFDYAHTNISDQCAEMCRSIRSVVLRELRGYQIDRGHGEVRIVEAMETLPIVERAVVKFEEELLVCQLNNVVIHDDFVDVMKQQRI